MSIRDVSHHDICRHGEHCINQIATRVLRDGVASYREWDEADRPLQFVLCTRFKAPA